MYDPVAKTAFVPAAFEIPWPIEFILRHHQKHVFMNRRLPSMGEVGKALDVWANSLRWRAFFHIKSYQDGGMPGPSEAKCDRWWRLRGNTCSAPFTGVLPEVWEAFISDACRSAYGACLSMRSKFSFNRNRVSNMNSIVRLGLSMLKSGEYGAVPTDKDGGYAMVHKTSFVAALIQSMGQNTYDRDVMLHDLSAQDYVENYASLVQWIAEDAHDPTLGHALLRDVRMGNRRFISRVIANVKTHKQPGNMGLRIIHSSPGLCISPAMRWISEHIRQFFSDKPHLLRDTDDLLFKLLSVVVSESAKLVRFDIRDYFMSGSHAQIADLAARCFPQHLQTCARALIFFILSEQVVVIHGCDQAWKVRKGAGMGLLCAGEISDAALYFLAEEHFAMDPEICAKYNIVFYSRFKDDGLYIVDSPRELHLQFVEQFKAKAGVYGIDFESISYETADMLDVTVFKGKKWRLTGRLDHSLYVKPSSQWRPLLCSSYHAPAVHLAWPVGMVKRFSRRFSNPHESYAAVLKFCSSLRASSGIDLNSILEERRREPSSPSPGIFSLPRLVLPYRREWMWSRVPFRFKQVVAKYARCLGLESLMRVPPVSWSLAGPHVVTTLRRHFYDLEALG